MLNSLILLLSQLLLTGSKLVPLTPSKIKHHADHAGLSQLLLLWKVLDLSNMENFYLFLNNNLSIVTKLMMDVVVD